MKSIRFLVPCVLLLTAVTTAAEPYKPATQPAKKPTTKPIARQLQIDYGPFVTATISTQWPEGGIVNKAIAIKLTDGKGGQGGILFDTDTCRVAAGWTGGFVQFTKDWTGVRDSKSVKIIGTQVFGTKPGPGWANPAGGKDAWRDPRTNGFGPLPKTWAKYKGLYLHGDQVILSYSIGSCDVLESPGIETDGDFTFITRTLQLGKSEKPVELVVNERGDAVDMIGLASVEPRELLRETKRWVGGAAILPDAMGRELVAEDIAGPAAGITSRGERIGGREILVIPAEATPCRFKILQAIYPRPNAAGNGRDGRLLDAARKGTPAADLTAATRGGPPRWPQTVTTAGKLAVAGKNDAYVVDTLTLPENNPYHAWMRPGGFDFFTSDPTKAAVCNWSGDVWVVSGIDATLANLKWQRIATGLFQPLGLRIVNDVIYVQGRDQITRLHDLNGDGEIDFYENFNNDVEVTSAFHEFSFDLQTDAAGNFYFSKAGPVKNGGHGFDEIAAHHGTVMRVAPDGHELEVIATGFRAPNGIGVSPEGQVTTGDNEGTYVPMCRINWVKPGGFYGVVTTSHRKEPPTTYDGPLCWMPKEVDNSSGGQVWVTSDKWGPFQNRLLHLSYGTCSLFLVLKEEVNGEVQGGVVRFPLSFESGIMRARFNPADGQLYVAGLKGWQTNASKDGCLQRVRYTGNPVRMPTSLNVTKTGLRIGFTTPINPEDGNDPTSFGVERWNYLYSDAYGSAHYSVADPTKHTHDAMEVKAAKPSADGRSVFITLPDLKPVMQMKTSINVKSADDVTMKYDVYHTVHKLGDLKAGE